MTEFIIETLLLAAALFALQQVGKWALRAQVLLRIVELVEEYGLEVSDSHWCGPKKRYAHLAVGQGELRAELVLRFDQLWPTAVQIRQRLDEAFKDSPFKGPKAVQL